MYYTRTTGISINLYNSSLCLPLYIYILYTYARTLIFDTLVLPEVHICASLPVADEIHMDCDGFRGIAQDAGSPFLNMSLPSKIVTSCQRETNLNQIWNMKWLITLVVISPPKWVTRTTGWTLFSGNSTQPRAPVLPVLRPFEALSGRYQFAINPKNPKDSTNLIFDASQMIFPSIFSSFPVFFRIFWVCQAATLWSSLPLEERQLGGATSRF